MTNKFNLFNERSKWCEKWIKNGRLTARAMAELKQIDGEFIRLLKEASESQDFDIMLEDGDDGDVTISFSEFIDILAGDKNEN